MWATIWDLREGVMSTGRRHVVSEGKGEKQCLVSALRQNPPETSDSGKMLFVITGYPFLGFYHEIHPTHPFEPLIMTSLVM